MELHAFFRELLPQIESIALAGEPEYTRIWSSQAILREEETQW
jgi:hypothetical protein